MSLQLIADAMNDAWYRGEEEVKPSLFSIFKAAEGVRSRGLFLGFEAITKEEFDRIQKMLPDEYFERVVGFKQIEDSEKALFENSKFEEDGTYYKVTINNSRTNNNAKNPGLD